MSEKLKFLLKKAFVDTDIKLEVLNVQETNLRHTVSSNTAFDHPSKWLLEDELENQCIDWVYQFLLSREFPDSWAAVISNLTSRQVMSDVLKMEKLKANEGGVNRIPTDQFEDWIADVLQNLCRDLHSKLANNKNKEDVDIILGKILHAEDECDLVKEVSVHAIKNTRRKMEDKHVILKYYSEMFGLPAQYSFYAIFDGHGGVEAARFSSTHLSGMLSKLLPLIKNNIPDDKSLKDKNKSTTQNKQQQNHSPIKFHESTTPKSHALLIPQLSKEDRKSFESIKASILKEETSQAKFKRNSYHESDLLQKVPRSNPVNVEDRVIRDGVIRDADGVREALEKSFLETNKMFCERARIENNGSGCTVVCLLMEGGGRKKFHVAWVGDSQVMLVRRGRPVEIMLPHKPEREDERLRITALGGSVVHFGTWRVNGTISVSRAIGDIGHKPYISSQPDTRSYTIHDDDDYLVLGCDGLWDVLTCDDVVNLVTHHLTVECFERKTVAQSLVRAAKEKGSSDNITVIVLFLKDDSSTTPTSHPDDEEQKIPDGNFRSKESENESSKGDHGKPSESKNDGKPNALGPGNPAGEISRSSLKTEHLFDLTRLSKKEIINSLKVDKNESETHFSEIKICSEADDTRRENLENEFENEKNEICESTNDDSKENYLASSAELPLEFSPLRSEVKGEHDVSSLTSVKSRIKRSPKISSSTGDKEDKENINQHLKMCLKPDMTPSACSDSSQQTEDVVGVGVGGKSLKNSIPLKLHMTLKRELKETNIKNPTKKDNIPAQTPDSKDSNNLVRVVPPNNHKQHPTNLHQLSKGTTQHPPKQPFSSTSSISVGLLRDSYRKFSQTSNHLKKLDLTPTSCRPPSNFGSCGLAEQARTCLPPGQKERWAVAIETGEDLEGMFECAGVTGLNASSSRW